MPTFWSNSSCSFISPLEWILPDLLLNKHPQPFLASSRQTLDTLEVHFIFHLKLVSFAKLLNKDNILIQACINYKTNYIQTRIDILLAGVLCCSKVYQTLGYYCQYQYDFQHWDTWLYGFILYLYVVISTGTYNYTCPIILVCNYQHWDTYLYSSSYTGT